MSNRPSGRRGSRRSELHAAQHRVTLASARALGCVCDPEMKTVREDGMAVVKMLHDLDCPLANAGSTYTLADLSKWVPHR